MAVTNFKGSKMSMKTRLIALLIVALAFNSMAAAKRLQVVTTTTDLKAITEAVGGEYVNVTSISSGKQDPHFIEAKPSYIIKLRKADLFIQIGLQLEIGWVSLILKGSRNSKIQMGARGFLDASENIEKLEIPTGPVDRSLGDVHTEGNPHYWLDPYNGRLMAHTITQKLSQLEPEYGAYFEQRKQVFVNSIDVAMFGPDLIEKFPADTLWKFYTQGNFEEYLKNNNIALNTQDGWAAQMYFAKGLKIITYHKSWTYFLKRFGITAVAQMEPKPGVPPSPKHILQLIQIANDHNIPIILMEPFYSDKAPNLVSRKTNAKVLKLGYSVNGDPGTNDYVNLMNNIVNKISAILAESTSER